MALLDVVNNKDEIVSQADYEIVHRNGLRHRSVQVFVFKHDDLDDLLVTQRSSNLQSGSKLHPSAAGHVKLGQTYEEAALDELREELFYEMDELPSGITLVTVASYKNDTRSTNRENTRLFHAVYDGYFSPDPREITRVYWQGRREIWADMRTRPDAYTQTFHNALREFSKWRGRE